MENIHILKNTLRSFIPFFKKYWLHTKTMARIEVILFIIVSYGLNYELLYGNLGYTLAPAQLDFLIKWGALIQMWIPGATAIVFRLIFGRGFKDIGWKIGSLKYWKLSILIPLSVPLVSYLIAFLIGNASLARQNVETFIYRDILNLFTINWPSWFPHNLGVELIVRAVIVLTVGLSINFIFAFGEELGWRGYLQQRIIATGFKFPFALCGLIWAGWHFPFLWFLHDSSPTINFQASLFIINIILLGVIVGRFRMDSGSVWIPTMVHAAHNTINFELFAAVITCNQCELYLNENGVIMAIVYGLFVLWLLKI